MKNPKISVIMAVYNEEKYIREAIESILNQTFRDFEFIIVDDGSTDNTPKILEEYAKKDSRIRILRNEKNIGLTKSLNKAIKQAKGEYIARMDADDIAMKERLEKQLDFMEKNPDVGLVGTSFYFINEEGKILGKNIYPTKDEDLRRILIKNNTFCHPSIMIRKEVFDKIGLYDESFETSQDYELYFRVAKYFKLANLEEPLLYWRVSKESISFKNEIKQRKNTIKAQIKAIKNGQYPTYCLIYILRPLLAILVPSKIKYLVRRYILKRKYTF